jgi:hypothetical protein
VGGKRRQPRLGPFTTEKQAKDALVDALGDMRSGTLTDDRRTTLAVYLTRWMEKQQLAWKGRPTTRTRKCAGCTGFPRSGTSSSPTCESSTSSRRTRRCGS